MKHKQKLGLVNAIGLPETARWKHEEKTGIMIGRLGTGDISGWSQGVSKPYGKVRPAELGCICDNMPECEGDNRTFSPPITSKSQLKTVEVPDKPHDANSLVMTGNAITRFDPTEHDAKANKRVMEINQRFEDNFKACRLTKADPSRKGLIKREKRIRFKPGIVGMDRQRKVKPEPVPDWQKEKEENGLLMLYWLTLRSIYRMIYS